MGRNSTSATLETPVSSLHKNVAVLLSQACLWGLWTIPDGVDTLRSRLSIMDGRTKMRRDMLCSDDLRYVLTCVYPNNPLGRTQDKSLTRLRKLLPCLQHYLYKRRDGRWVIISPSRPK